LSPWFGNGRCGGNRDAVYTEEKRKRKGEGVRTTKPLRTCTNATGVYGGTAAFSCKRCKRQLRRGRCVQ